MKKLKVAAIAGIAAVGMLAAPSVAMADGGNKAATESQTTQSAAASVSIKVVFVDSTGAIKQESKLTKTVGSQVTKADLLGLGLPGGYGIAVYGPKYVSATTTRIQVVISHSIAYTATFYDSTTGKTVGTKLLAGKPGSAVGKSALAQYLPEGYKFAEGFESTTISVLRDGSAAIQVPVADNTVSMKVVFVDGNAGNAILDESKTLRKTVGSQVTKSDILHLGLPAGYGIAAYGPKYVSATTKRIQVVLSQSIGYTATFYDSTTGKTVGTKLLSGQPGKAVEKSVFEQYVPAGYEIVKGFESAAIHVSNSGDASVSIPVAAKTSTTMKVVFVDGNAGNAILDESKTLTKAVGSQVTKADLLGLGLPAGYGIAAYGPKYVSATTTRIQVVLSQSIAYTATFIDSATGKTVGTKLLAGQPGSTVKKSALAQYLPEGYEFAKGFESAMITVSKNGDVFVQAFVTKSVETTTPRDDGQPGTDTTDTDNSGSDATDTDTSDTDATDTDTTDTSTTDTNTGTDNAGDVDVDNTGNTGNTGSENDGSIAGENDSNTSQSTDTQNVDKTQPSQKTAKVTPKKSSQAKALAQTGVNSSVAFIAFATSMLLGAAALALKLRMARR
ncbi:MAG: hypothetical protein LKJ47_07350 [Bifidobacteriaceae bacterium]|jgi:CRISPR/Cas system CMR-associated protein Cmr5 small subunit|nr:hypothetical protein [Bifidobacteriaceae bacterium]